MKDGFLAYERGDYATAARIFRPLAEQGDASPQYQLATMYHEGKGVPKDIAEAIKWYRLAAEGGDPLAQNNLGLMYRSGQEVRQDYVEAVKWLRSQPTRVKLAPRPLSAICMSTATSFR